MFPRCNIFRIVFIRLIRCRPRCRPFNVVCVMISMILFGAIMVFFDDTAKHKYFTTQYSWTMLMLNSTSATNGTDVIGYKTDVINIETNDFIVNTSCGSFESNINDTLRHSMEMSEIVAGAPAIDYKCILNVLESHLLYCTLSMSSVPGNTPVAGKKNTCSALCPCIPYNLHGRVAPSLDLNREINTTGIQPGGRWHPSHCISRSRIALIIPFANRHRHLKVFIKHIIPFLQRQLIDFQIFVVEQSNFTLFNKAMLMNAGFLEVIKRGSFDCFIFHDVDLLPIDDRHFYSCSGVNALPSVSTNWTIGPAHLGIHIDINRYSLLYHNLFGGATAFTKEQFEKVNGYALEFYGWGGEDDDMMQRLIYKKYYFTRRAQCVSIYRAIKHPSDGTNPQRDNRFMGTLYRPSLYDKEGLRQTNYTIQSTVYEALYTHIYIVLPPPPPTLTPPPRHASNVLGPQMIFRNRMDSQFMNNRDSSSLTREFPGAPAPVNLLGAPWKQAATSR